MTTPRNHIEFRDTVPSGAAHFASTVLIDGVEVLIAEDGAGIEFAHNDVTAVTLRILPHRVSFN